MTPGRTAADFCFLQLSQSKKARTTLAMTKSAKNTDNAVNAARDGQVKLVTTVGAGVGAGVGVGGGKCLPNTVPSSAGPTTIALVTGSALVKRVALSSAVARFTSSWSVAWSRGTVAGAIT